MARQFPLMTLREAGVSLIDCVHKTPPEATEGHKYIAIPQMKNGWIDDKEARVISFKDFDEWTKKALPKKDDVILSRRCNPGETAYVPENVKWALGQNLVILRSDGSKVYPPYLRWLVRSTEWWDQVNKFINVGAIFNSLKCADVPNFLLPIPEITVQKRIAHALNSIDGKIELNNKINKTLELMTKAIFKEWFIDFGPVKSKSEGVKPFNMDDETSELFPEGFEESEFGLVPKGWTYKPLSYLLDTISETYKFKPNEKVIFLNTSDISKGEFLTSQLTEADTLPGQAKKKIKEGDILYSEIRPENCRYAYVYFDSSNYVVSTKLMVLRSKEIDPIFFYFYLTRDEFVSEMQRLAEARSGTFPQITFEVLGSRQILLPEKKVLKRFIEILRPIHNQRLSLISENKHLVSTRDLFLPKLISGEISLNDV